MKKGPKIAVSVLAVAIVAVAVIIFYSPQNAAALYIEKGQVFYDSGKGWQPAKDEMNLKENYKVKTGAASMASIVFYEKDILRLEENTEINLQELSSEKISVKQDSGSTWNKVSRLAGQESYEVQTPASVASVRGTGFLIDITPDSENILVGDGIVNFESGGKDRDISQKRKARLINGEINELALDALDIARIRKNLESDIERLKKIRQKIIDDNNAIFALLKQRTGWSDADVQSYLESVDRGEYNTDDLLEKSPVKLDALRKIADITKEIQRLNQLLENEALRQ